MKKIIVLIAAIVTASCAAPQKPVTEPIPACDAQHVGIRHGGSVCREYTGNDRVLKGIYYWHWEP